MRTERVGGVGRVAGAARPRPSNQRCSIAAAKLGQGAANTLPLLSTDPDSQVYLPTLVRLGGSIG